MSDETFYCSRCGKCTVQKKYIKKTGNIKRRGRMIHCLTCGKRRPRLALGE